MRRPGRRRRPLGTTPPAASTRKRQKNSGGYPQPKLLVPLKELTITDGKPSSMSVGLVGLFSKSHVLV